MHEKEYDEDVDYFPRCRKEFWFLLAWVCDFSATVLRATYLLLLCGPLLPTAPPLVASTPRL